MRLALLPGLDGTGILFDPLVDRLSADLDPLIVRYPRSCEQSITGYAALAGDALSDGGRWLLLAESFSGPVALRLLADRPGLDVAGIVFSASFSTPPRHRLLRLLKHAPLRTAFGMHVPTWLLRALCVGSEAGDATIASLRKALSEAGPDILAARLRMLADLPASAVRISIPGLYIRPTSDRLVPPSTVHQFERQFRQMEVCEVAGPHFVLRTDPECCARIIESFAASIMPSSE